MPKLRKMLQDICNRDMVISYSTYALLQALVETVDGGKHTCEECKFFNDYYVFPCRNTPYHGGRRTTAMHVICDDFQARVPVELEDIDVTCPSCCGSGVEDADGLPSIGCRKCWGMGEV